MVLPQVIHEVSPLDPLLLLPLPKHLPPSPRPDLPALVSALERHLDPSSSTPKIPIQLLSAQMRQITRRSQVLLNASRVGAGQAREGLDKRDVLLRGVEYERDRVREEIERCEDYAPVFRQLGLEDEESFLGGADEGVLGTLTEHGHPDREYALTHARLKYELSEIKKREAVVAQLSKEREGLVRAKKEIKQKFDAVDVYLADFAKTANAVASKVKDVAKVAAPAAL